MTDAEQPLVLVADDDEDIVNLICFRMEHAGYRTMRAADGAEALRLAKELRPDICILDVVMPELTGYGVVEALRADPQTADMPVILLTATIQERERARGYELGANAYMTKPFDGAELQNRVAALLAR